MSGQNIKFEKVPFSWKPKKYLEYLRDKMGIHFTRNVKVGEAVTIDLPKDGKKFRIFYLGETPEKYAVDANVLTVYLPKTVLVYVCEDPTKVSHFRVEVFIAS